jgi:hypothetical protein
MESNNCEHSNKLVCPNCIGGPLTRSKAKLMGVSLTPPKPITEAPKEVAAVKETPDLLQLKSIEKYAYRDKQAHYVWLAKPNLHDLLAVPSINANAAYKLSQMDIKTPTDLLARYMLVNCDIGLFYHSISHCFGDSRDCEAAVRAIAELSYKLLKM